MEDKLNPSEGINLICEHSLEHNKLILRIISGDYSYLLFSDCISYAMDYICEIF